VLAGADNTGNYVYLGTIFADGNFRVTRKSRVAADAPSAVAFAWFVRNLESAKVDVWHDGTCGRCGRKLTVPESIESGLGPVCAGRGAALDPEPVAPVAAVESTPAKELLAERRARAEAIVDAAIPRVPFTPAERAMLVDWGTEPESTPAVGATVAPAIPRWAF
jgi:hypothetical protein